MSLLPQTTQADQAPPLLGYPVNLLFAARNLLDLDIASHSDPFLVLSQYLPESNSWIRVGMTEVISDNLNPTWERPIQVWYYPPPLLSSPLPYFPPPASNEVEIVKNVDTSDCHTSEERLRRLSLSYNPTTLDSPPTTIMRLPSSATATISTLTNAQESHKFDQLLTPSSYLDYRIQIFDCDHDDLLDHTKHDFLGQYYFNLQNLLETNDHSINHRLFTAKTPVHYCKTGTFRILAFPYYIPSTFALCTCRIEQMKRPKSNLQLQFLQIDHLNHPRVVYASEIHEMVEDPEFAPFRLNLTTLCQLDPQKEFLFRLVSHESPQDVKILTENHLTLKDLLIKHGEIPKWFTLSTNLAHPVASHDSDDKLKFGNFIIEECDTDYNFSLQHFLQQSLIDFSITFAVDFTTSPDSTKIESVHQLSPHYKPSKRSTNLLYGTTVFNEKKRNLFDGLEPLSSTPTNDSVTESHLLFSRTSSNQSNPNLTNNSIVCKALQLLTEIFSPVLTNSNTNMSTSTRDTTALYSPNATTCMNHTDLHPGVKGIRTLALTGNPQFDKSLQPLSFDTNFEYAFNNEDLLYHYSLACQSPALEPTTTQPFTTLINAIALSLPVPSKFNHKPAIPSSHYSNIQKSSPVASPRARLRQSSVSQHALPAFNTTPQPPTLNYEILVIITPFDSISSISKKQHDRDELIKCLQKTTQKPLSIIFILLDQFNDPNGLDFVNTNLAPILLPAGNKLLSKLLSRSNSNSYNTDDFENSKCITRRNVQFVPIYSFPMSSCSQQMGRRGSISMATPSTPSSHTTRHTFSSQTLNSSHTHDFQFIAQPIAKQCFFSTINMHLSQQPQTSPTHTNQQNSPLADQPTSPTSPSPHFTFCQSLTTNPQNSQTSTPLASPKSISPASHGSQPLPAPVRQAPSRPREPSTLSIHSRPSATSSPNSRRPSSTTLVLPQPPLSTILSLDIDPLQSPSSASSTSDPKQTISLLAQPDLIENSTILHHPSIFSQEPIIDPPKSPGTNFFITPQQLPSSTPTPRGGNSRRPSVSHTSNNSHNFSRPRRRSSVARPVHIVDPWDSMIQRYSGVIWHQLQSQVLDYLAASRLWAHQNPISDSHQ